MDHRGRPAPLAGHAAAGLTTIDCYFHEQALSESQILEEQLIECQRRGKRKTGPRTMKRSFVAENGWKVVVSSKQRGSYHDIEQALLQALQEIRHYIDNGVQLY